MIDAADYSSSSVFLDVPKTEVHLTHYCPHSVFRLFLINNLRQALFVYQLIDAAHVGFFIKVSHILIELLAKRD